MKLIFTMAGEFSRFFDFSMKIPKYLLPSHDGLVIDSILKHFEPAGLFDEVVFACHKKDATFKRIIESRKTFFPNSAVDFVYLSNTSSQVETAKLALLASNSTSSFDKPCLFANIDTILMSRDYKQVADLLATNHGFLDSFRAFDKHYSYLLANENGEVSSIREKVLISEYACSGLYGINSPRTFLSSPEVKNNQFHNFSEFFQNLIDQGKSVVCKIEPLDKNTLVLGSPAQYLDYLSSSRVCS